MSGHWETVRQAIATKCFSAALQTAGIRAADTKTDEVSMLPCIKVGLPDYEQGNVPDAWQEYYRLTFPAQLLVARPAGAKRSEPTVADLARAIQIEWRTGHQLGLTTATAGGLNCTGSWFQSMQQGLGDAYADTDLDGARLAFVVDIREVLAAART
jgi:hypothetical protein